MNQSEAKAEDLVCKEPNYGFQFRTALDLATHRSESKHMSTMCPLCRKDFTQVGNLQRLMRTVYGHIAWRCNQCNKSFSRSDNFRRHLTTFHGQNFNQNLPECNKPPGHVNSYAKNCDFWKSLSQ